MEGQAKVHAMVIDEFISVLRRQASLSEKECAKIKTACLRDRTSLTHGAVKTKLVSENEVLSALGLVFSIEFMEILPQAGAMPECALAVSRQFLKKMCMVPLTGKKSAPVIAVNDPLNFEAVDDIADILEFETYSVVLSGKSQILSAINALYDRAGKSAQQLVEDMEENHFLIIDDNDQPADLLDDTSEAPVIRLVNHIISQAVKAGASDIHIEPFQDILQVRYRIDGLLYEMLCPPKAIQSSLISRIKVMAGMNIAEKRLPQDGRAQVRIGNIEIDIRISTVPTSYGERLVMRLLNKSGYFLDLSEFGLSRADFSLINSIITQNNGMVLVTGPTGSGKTTTLYAVLSKINSSDKNIITIEDPIEYNLKGIGQIQVNTKTGVTFAKGLRSIVRQDPDVVLVGEIRDGETARIAIQSALTGHLVFSTLHTNDSAGAVTRLVDLGIEPYLITSSVNAVIAQRLVRVLCRKCRQEYRIKPSHLHSLNGAGSEYTGMTAFRPKGCPECFNTGYSGRQAIFEIMTINETLKSLILETSDSNLIRKAAVSQGMKTLRQDGMLKIKQGITSIDEVLRVTQ